MRAHHQAEHETNAGNAFLCVENFVDKFKEILCFILVLPVVDFSVLNLLGDVLNLRLENLRYLNKSFVQHWLEYFLTILCIVKIFKISLLFCRELSLTLGALLLHDRKKLVTKGDHQLLAESLSEGSNDFVDA